MKSLSDLLDTSVLTIGTRTIAVSNILMVLIIIVLTAFILWLIKKAIFRHQGENRFDEGNRYALFQIIKYVVWVVSIGFMLQSLGVKLTMLIAGSAALLVGVGLGLQQTFNDVISGIILLSERSIKVGDILEIDDDIITIQEIGLRTSKGLNRDDISIIIPNSLITTNKVINWSHQSRKTRFRINVGVAYGSDVNRVFDILKKCTIDHPDITDEQSIEVRLVDFGSSSLDFQVLFYSDKIFRIEKVKSDIRRKINQKLAESNITIPFPQLDIHFKNPLINNK